MEVSRYWRLQPQRYRLVGKVCDHCATKTFPPKGVCPECGHIVHALFSSNKSSVYPDASIYDASTDFET